MWLAQNQDGGKCDLSELVSSAHFTTEFSWCLGVHSSVYSVNRRELSTQPWGLWSWALTQKMCDCQSILSACDEVQYQNVGCCTQTHSVTFAVSFMGEMVLNALLKSTWNILAVVLIPKTWRLSGGQWIYMTSSLYFKILAFYSILKFLDIYKEKKQEIHFIVRIYNAYIDSVFLLKVLWIVLNI